MRIADFWGGSYDDWQDSMVRAWQKDGIDTESQLGEQKLRASDPSYTYPTGGNSFFPSHFSFQKTQFYEDWPGCHEVLGDFSGVIV